MGQYSARASGAIGALLFVIGTTTDKVISQAAGPYASIIGVSSDVPTDDGEVADFSNEDQQFITFGGAVAFGDPLTSDSQGRAVLATPGDSIGGFAGENIANANAIGKIFMSLHRPSRSLKDMGTLPAFDGTTHDTTPTVVHEAIYDVPATTANSTVTLPNPGAGAIKNGTRMTFQADGVKNANTVTYRDASGTVVLTAAATAAKRHQAVATFYGTKWMVALSVGA